MTDKLFELRWDKEGPGRSPVWALVGKYADRIERDTGRA